MRKLLIGGAIGALAVALLALTAFTAFGGSDGDSAAAQSVRRVGLMHVGTDHIPPALKPLKARTRGARLDGGEEHRADLAQPRAGAGRGTGQGVRPRARGLIVAFEDQSIDAAGAATGTGGIEFRSSSSIPPTHSATAWPRAWLVQAGT